MTTLNQLMINTARVIQASLVNHKPSINNLLAPTNISTLKLLDDAISEMVSSNPDALIYTIRLYKILKSEYKDLLADSLSIDIELAGLVNDDVISYTKLNETNKLVFEIIMHLSLLPMKE